MWANKYTPKKLKEVKGNKESIQKLEYFIKNFKKQKRKAVLLVGPTGTGKTCSVYAFANENDYEVLELNASDERNKGNIEEFMRNATTQMSLFMKPKIILIDEVDGLSGTKDRGGGLALAKFIDETNFPIIMTANDISLEKISLLIKKAEILEFNELETNDVFERLKEICEKEKLKLDEFILKSIASRSGGDLRAAINDLQVLSSGKIKKEDLELIGDRKREKEIENILRLIFKSTDINLVNKGMEDVDLDLLQSWLSENIPLEYNKLEIKNAFDSLSKADVFKGRITRWQYWRFLVYQKFLLGKVALCKEKKNGSYIKYKRPRKGLLIWQTNMKNLKRRSISEKLAIYNKVSKKKAFRDIYPEIYLLLKDKKIQKNLELNEEEIDWVENFK